MVDIEFRIGGGCHLQIVPDGLNVSVFHHWIKFTVLSQPTVDFASQTAFPKEDILPLPNLTMTYTIDL